MCNLFAWFQSQSRTLRVSKVAIPHNAAPCCLTNAPSKIYYALLFLRRQIRVSKRNNLNLLFRFCSLRAGFAHCVWHAYLLSILTCVSVLIFFFFFLFFFFFFFHLFFYIRVLFYLHLHVRVYVYVFVWCLLCLFLLLALFTVMADIYSHNRTRA